MIHLKVLNLQKSIFFVLFKALLPILIELLHVLSTNGDVLFHLRCLNVGAQLVLEANDFSFKQSHLLHQIFIQLILVNFAAFVRKQLHFLFDDREDDDLLVLVKNSVTTQIKHFDELLRRIQSQEVVNVVSFRFENKAYVGLVKDTFPSKVGLLDGLPDLLAFASTADEWSCFLDKFLDFMARHVCQTGECLHHMSAH